MPDWPLVVAAVSAVAAVASGVTSAYFARLQYRGCLVIHWRLREQGFTTIDVIVRNIGGGSIRNVEITSDRGGFRPLRFQELPAGAEYCVDTLSGRSTAHRYHATHGSPPLRRRRRQTWLIAPRDFPGVQTRDKTALRQIADTLGSVETMVRDSPVLRDAGNALAISRTGEPEWTLPSGVLAVILPAASETRRNHLQDETALADSSRQRRPSGSSVGSHVPEEIMRVIVDPEVLSPEDERKLDRYLHSGDLNLHWDRQHRPLTQYVITGVIGGYREARVLERRVLYKQS